MFFCIIFIWPCDLDLLTLALSGELSFACPVHVPICSILQLFVPEFLSYDLYCVKWGVKLYSFIYSWVMCDSIWSHYLHLERSLRMRRVTWPITGVKNDPHFWNPWTQFTYSLCHFYGVTTNFKPCYRQKIAFSHCEGYKVNCTCAVSRDLCIGGPPKPHVTIFWPRIVYSLYNLYGATTTIKGSFILERPHVKTVFGRKKKLSSQNRSPNGGFSEI